MKDGGVTRRRFLTAAGAGVVTGPLAGHIRGQEQEIQGFDETNAGELQQKEWTPVSDRTIKVGIVGYGVCKFGAKFGFQNHPNVEVVAVSDLFEDRCAELARVCGCETTYPSLAELLKDVGLYSYRYDAASILSRGLLQRLAIARALVHKPPVLLADEPFTGLDAEASKYLIKVFAEFTAGGGTIMMTTHDTYTGLQCCDRAVVLDKRELIFDAPTSQIDTAEFAKDYLSYSRSRN